MNTTLPGQSHACHQPEGNDLRHTGITGTPPNAETKQGPADRVLVTAPCFVPANPPSWVRDDNVDADGFAPEVHGFWEQSLGESDGLNLTVTQYVRETAEHPGLLCISPAYVAGYTLALNPERNAGGEGDLDLRDVGVLAALLVMANALMRRADEETRAWARANGGTVLC